jgi:hypothetical protein
VVDTGANPTESFCTDWSRQNSDDRSSKQTPSLELSYSLQFVHDVHPYQKSKHTIDTFDKCQNKNVPPYVMRIQGIKTDADKGKSVLPKIKVSVYHKAVK